MAAAGMQGDGIDYEQIFGDVNALSTALAYIGVDGEMADAMRDLRDLGYGEQVDAFRREARLDELNDLTNLTDCLAPAAGYGSLEEMAAEMEARGLDWRREMAAGLPDDCADIRRRLDRVLAARAETFRDFDYPPEAAQAIAQIKDCVEFIRDGPLRIVEAECAAD